MRQFAEISLKETDFSLVFFVLETLTAFITKTSQKNLARDLTVVQTILKYLGYTGDN